MPNLTAMRGWQFDQLRNSIRVYQHFVDTTDREALLTLRDGENGWNVLEMLCHMRDFEAIFLERAQMTMAGGFPTLPFPDPDKLAIEKNYADQDIDAVMAAWQANREAFLGYLGELDEDDWEKAANHPKRGWFTLHDQLLLANWHDMNHLNQLTKILGKQERSA